MQRLPFHFLCAFSSSYIVSLCLFRICVIPIFPITIFQHLRVSLPVRGIMMAVSPLKGGASFFCCRTQNRFAPRHFAHPSRQFSGFPLHSHSPCGRLPSQSDNDWDPKGCKADVYLVRWTGKACRWWSPGWRWCNPRVPAPPRSGQTAGENHRSHPAAGRFQAAFGGSSDPPRPGTGRCAGRVLRATDVSPFAVPFLLTYSSL